MASLHPVEILQKGVKHGISAQNHFQKRRKKLFGNLIAMGFLPIFLWQRRRIRSHAEVKQSLKHYPSWAESVGKLGLKTLCGCPQKAKCHVQVTVRICSAVKTLQKSGVFLSWKLLTTHKSLSFQVYWSSADVCCLQRLEQALTLAKTDPYYCLSQSCV